jgi:hypothetical protein
MGPVSATISIDVSREEVHQLLADLSSRPAFTDHFIDEFRLERMEPAGVGAAARFRVPKRKLWIETVIVENEAPHRLLERGRGGRLDRIPVSTAWSLVEGPGSRGCEVTVTFVTEPVAITDRVTDAMARMRGIEGWYRRQWARALSRLKDLAESSQEPDRLVVAGADRNPG